MSDRFSAVRPASSSVFELIGGTPLVQLRRMTAPGMADVLVKLEQFNPSSSLKDRVAVALIEDAEAKGLLRSGATVVEATCGAMGVSLALVCAVKGHPVVLVMPESVSPETLALLRAYGAQVELTAASRHFAGAFARARERVAEIPGAFMPNQLENPVNVKAHFETTGRELVESIEENGGGVDALVMGAGTAGTVIGVGRALKDHFPAVRVIVVQPNGASHRINGLIEGEIQPLLDLSIIDRTIRVDDALARGTQKRLAREEGMLVGISSGANVAAALEIGRELGAGRRVYTLCCDTGERYFSLASGA